MVEVEVVVSLEQMLKTFGLVPVCGEVLCVAACETSLMASHVWRSREWVVEALPWLKA